jgi:hypothetical protein
MAAKYFPGFRRATPATSRHLHKNQRVFPSAKLSSVPRRLRSYQRLFWRREFDPSPDMPGPSNFRLPEFFHSCRGMKGDFMAFQKTKLLRSVFLSSIANPQFF